MSVLPTARVTSACLQMEEKKRQQQQPVRTDYWLQPNIVVKVVTKKLGERYHKRKAVVMVIPRDGGVKADDFSFKFRSER